MRPDPYVPGFDTFESNGSSIGLVAIGQRRIPAGTTVQSWVERLRREGSVTYAECGPMSKARVGKLGGAAAVQILFPCDAHQVNAELLLAAHEGIGWAVLCAADDRSAVPLEAVCGPLLATFHFA
jgi:aryl-alcohol dehydrogenase-like predicted oxidoreductase